MNVVFMGTPEFAVASLKALVEKHTLLGVVCQPDRPNLRGNKTVYGAVKQFSLERGYEIFQPESVKEAEFINKLRDINPDVIVVAAYGRILPRDILRLPKHGCINVHASLLPKYRGAAPIQWAIINGEFETGVTIMLMDEGLDTGDMLKKRHVVIEPSDTYGILLEKLANVGAEELISALDEIERHSARRIIQNDAEATYAPVIKKETGRINWENSAEAILNMIRALNPSPGAYCMLDGKKLKIWGAEVLDKPALQADFGVVIDVIPDKGIVVNAEDKSVVITELQISGSRKMTAPDFLRGHKVEIGTQLG